MSGKYRTIVADPPWAYDEGWPAITTSENGWKPQGVKANARYGLPYASMTVAAIGCLPVEALAADDAHLLLWTTNRYVRRSYGIVEAWGFRPSQLLTWCKPRRGMGPGGVFANGVST